MSKIRFTNIKGTIRFLYSDYLIYDNFNDIPGTLIINHTPDKSPYDNVWHEYVYKQAGFKIAPNGTYLIGGNNQFFYASLDTGKTAHTAEVRLHVDKVTTPGDMLIGLLTRYYNHATGADRVSGLKSFCHFSANRVEIWGPAGDWATVPYTFTHNTWIIFKAIDDGVNLQLFINDISIWGPLEVPYYQGLEHTAAGVTQYYAPGECWIDWFRVKV